MLNMGFVLIVGTGPCLYFLLLTFVMVSFCALFYSLRRDMRIVAKLAIEYTSKATDRFSAIQKYNDFGPIEHDRGNGSYGRST